ncbi:NAD(P)-binding Rossmann-fold containing protein [Glarea lozoyensis ATCC 20868]|uniref:NAD(P)-binding Rossmann-fold containing protein n=1 Tax=Glarea lozoyensis (strain ATCC 20868 / MF5171) TaxID=1116229 RepID=S3DAV8_GLAL2|nr:NAD(P)-binding Rossmann-fold containing protein [Glarea lozoyensis ATCC 20868]EPE34835.1 NAD(P)-binding Rossmann-fold containing protein [Glarea lozoyensis ATCC 20868]
MTQTVVLITGANRGIGKGLLELYLLKPNHLVIAGNRDPEHATSKALATLPTADGTRLLVIKIDATVPTDAAAAAKLLAKDGVDYIDIVIANAGVAYVYPKVSEVKTEDMQRHIVPNVYGNVWLYQAMLPLLKRSEKKMWVSIGSSAAYLTVVPSAVESSGSKAVKDASSWDSKNMIPFQNAAYAPTKLVLHWLTKAMHMEEPELTAFPIDPGWVQTDLGNHAAHSFNIEKAAITSEESVTGMVKVIDVATRDSHGGKLWEYNGVEVPW